MKKKVYLIFVLLFTVQLLKAQAPGGVGSFLKLWIKSNHGTAADIDNLLSDWEYANIEGFKFSATGSNRPTLLPNKINFNPAVNFAGLNFMDGPVGSDAPISADNDEFTVIAVWQTSAVSARQSIWAQGKATNLSGDYFSFFTLNGEYGNAFQEPPTS